MIKQSRIYLVIFALGICYSLNSSSSDLITLDDYNNKNLLFNYLKIKDTFSIKTNLLKEIESIDSSSFEFFQENYMWFYDPNNQLNRLIDFKFKNNKLISLRFYKDFDSKEIHDFSLDVVNKKNNLKIKKIKDLPLKGYKIALDPGHFGEDLYTNFTKKHVQTFKKTKDGLVVDQEIREAFLNLVVGKIVKKKLENLGALVLLTKNDLGPVALIDFKDFEASKVTKEIILSSSNEKWFLNLLSSMKLHNTSISELIKESEKLQSLLSHKRKFKKYLIYDLYERARIINEFKPDISLIIHFDTFLPKSYERRHTINPEKYNKTKAFIPGNFSFNSLSSNKNRYSIYSNFLNSTSLKNSIDLTRNIVDSLSSNLNIALDNRPGKVWSSIKVEDGIYARNLALTRLLTNTAISYLECLYYNSEDEFNNLLRKDHKIKINNIDYTYSHRLVEVSNAIVEGLLRYAKNRSQ
jgi:N-acetylmuramoyl-L-alanine amidase